MFVQSSRLLNDIFYRPCLARAEKYMAKFIKPEAKSRNQKPETRKEFRVYQVMTEFAITVKARSKKEAIKIATASDNSNNWDSYESNGDNISYEAVLMEPKKGGKIK